MKILVLADRKKTPATSAGFISDRVWNGARSEGKWVSFLCSVTKKSNSFWAFKIHQLKFVNKTNGSSISFATFGQGRAKFVKGGVTTTSLSRRFKVMHVRQEDLEIPESPADWGATIKFRLVILYDFEILFCLWFHDWEALNWGIGLLAIYRQGGGLAFDLFFLIW